ncbi:hypothetical protein JNO12_23465 [Erwinia aphidicola]|nr:hypothetical protein [Erwinia aphidicola]
MKKKPLAAAFVANCSVLSDVNDSIGHPLINDKRIKNYYHLLSGAVNYVE